MTYYSDIARMLGLALGEEFKIKEENETRPETYQFTKDGLQSRTENVLDWKPVNEIIPMILKGDFEISKMKWKPKPGEYYFVFELRKDAGKWKWQGNSMDLAYWKSGNCFKTFEDAEIAGKDVVKRQMREYAERILKK